MLNNIILKLSKRVKKFYTLSTANR